MRSCEQICVWVVLGIFLVIPAQASAQIVGVEGGLSFAKLISDDPDAPALDWLKAPTGGLFIVFGPNTVTGRVDVLYSVKGARAPFGDYKFTYIEAPVGVQFNFARGSDSDVHVFAQTTIGFKLDAKLDVADSDEQVDIEDVDDLDFGVTVGAGATFGRFVVNGRYTHGIRDINKLGEVVKTRSVAIMAGYRFGS